MRFKLFHFHPLYMYTTVTFFPYNIFNSIFHSKIFREFLKALILSSFREIKIKFGFQNMWNWIKTLVKTPYQECYAKPPYKVGQYRQIIGPPATLHAIFDPMTYGLKSDLKSYMILGSNKSWAELDYTVINLLKFLFQNCMNNFLILWWLLFSQLVLMIIAIFPYISLYTV